MLLLLLLVQKVPTNASKAYVWVMLDGTVLSVCHTFEDWFGFVAKELQGTLASSVVVKQSKLIEE
jgi:hypothetical protein